MIKIEVGTKDPVVLDAVAEMFKKVAKAYKEAEEPALPHPSEPKAQKAPSKPKAPDTQAHGAVLDATGLPWDARIHSSSKRIMKGSGTWKKKRGVRPTVTAAIEAELRAATKPVVPAGPEAQADTSMGVVITDFQTLLGRIGVLNLPTETVTAACEKVGARSLALLATRPDLVPKVAVELGL